MQIEQKANALAVKGLSTTLVGFAVHFHSDLQTGEDAGQWDTAAPKVHLRFARVNTMN